jgi:L-lactate dehydrogenase (cytochrome)
MGVGMVRSLRSVVQLRKFEADPVVRRLASSGDIADLRKIAKRRLPGGVFDYIDGGAEGEITLGRNSEAFRELVLHPHVLQDVSSIDLSTTLLGKPRTAPLVLAPTGFTRIAHPEGELAVARAAGKRGLPYGLSTLGTRSIEELARVATAPLWFQVYVWKDRGLVKELISRSAAAGYEALMVTVDTAVLGRRERDVRRGFSLPPKIGLETFIDGALHPGWSLDLVRNDPITFANLVDHDDINGSTAVTLSDFVNKQFDQAMSWEQLDWIRSASDLPVILKGVQRVDDAQRAAKEGLKTILLSNHGGRQLDTSPAPIELLPQVKDAVGDSLEVMIDGGIRRGSDIVKACALGASAVSIGRPYLYGLAAGGERGVDFVIEHLLKGMERTMQLCGVTKVSELTSDLLNPSS